VATKFKEESYIFTKTGYRVKRNEWEPHAALPEFGYDCGGMLGTVDSLDKSTTTLMPMLKTLVKLRAEICGEFSKKLRYSTTYFADMFPDGLHGSYK